MVIVTIQTQSWIWRHSRAGGAAKLVELALADLGSYGDDPSETWLRTDWLVDDLAHKCGMEHGEILSALTALERLGEAEVIGDPSGTRCIFHNFRSAAVRG